MAAQRDPREIITPDAFSVKPDLLGLPLARPWRRGAAMSIDLIAIALLTRTGGFALGLVAAAVLLRIAIGSTPDGRRWSRTALGCLGAVVLFATIVAGWQALFDEDRPEVSIDGDMAPEVSFRQAGAMVAEIVALTRADDEQEAREIAAAVRRLRTPVARALARDDLERLESRVRRLNQRNERLEEELETAREGPSLVRATLDLADEIGIGFGWTGLYFTLFLWLWSGRTPGKRLLGLRVVRLDGSPIGWWVAFNRFGGYAASIFTGFIGFFEMFWDANRQALHDRIAHTVVVLERGGNETPEAERA